MIREAVHRFLEARDKQWAHDRSTTIGASEIGQCERRVWFAKNAEPADTGYVNRRGAAARGDLIEEHVWVPALAAALPEGARIHHAGAQQRTLTHGYLSATPDAIVTGLPADYLKPLGIPDASGAVLFECKSIDPRVNLREAKAEHRAQVQVQLGIVRAATEWKPVHAVVSYIDASFLDNVEEFAVQFDPAQFAAAEKRALRIMDAASALDVRPEGKMAGGKECEHCPFKSRCAHEAAAGFPQGDEKPLGDNAVKAIIAAAERALAARDWGDQAKAREAEAKEEIKEIMRGHNVRRVAAGPVSVAWSMVKGRQSLDAEAAKAAGVDLTPFQREGEPSERLMIKVKEGSEA